VFFIFRVLLESAKSFPRLKAMPRMNPEFDLMRFVNIPILRNNKSDGWDECLK
jgi:hypothetical protein